MGRTYSGAVAQLSLKSRLFPTLHGFLHQPTIPRSRISKLGGLTKIKQARDLCVSMGIGMTLEDSWGGDITTAAIAHLAHSAPEEFRFTSTDFNNSVTVSTADGAPQRVNGFMSASTQPGLGITPKLDVLGPRVLEVA